MWNPWRGCKRVSDGCKYCYIHKGNKRKGIDTSVIVKTRDFDKPLQKYKNGEYKIKSGSTVYLCFSSDFFLEDADSWRDDCWMMIKKRNDLNFLFLTKRIDRFHECIPSDWNDGYDNVEIGCTVENQSNVDYKLNIFSKLPIKHKIIILQPLLEKVDISKYLNDIKLVVVGGESDKSARPLDYDWVVDIREQCIRAGVSFEFRQCGSKFIKNNKLYNLKVKDLTKQARVANIDYIIK
jgi:protein gp37